MKIYFVISRNLKYFLSLLHLQCPDEASDSCNFFVDQRIPWQNLSGQASETNLTRNDEKKNFICWICVHQLINSIPLSIKIHRKNLNKKDLNKHLINQELKRSLLVENLIMLVIIVLIDSLNLVLKIKFLVTWLR